MKSTNVIIGFRAKTGRAIGVVLAGSRNSPSVIRKFEIKLTDPKVPGTFQPYHEVMEMPWEQGQKVVRTFTRPIEVVARKTLATIIKDLKADGFVLKSLCVVGSKDRDLGRIGNYHIRAHAAEGILFRRVLELAAAANDIRARTFSDREIEQLGAAQLKLSPASLKQALNDLGRSLDPPWRSDEKHAALAAWLMLRG